MKEALRELLASLQSIAEDHDEIYDTVCREYLSDAVFGGFVDRKPDFELGDRFGLYEDEGNKRVRAVLATYLEKVNSSLAEMGETTLLQRLAFFQDPDVFSPDGEPYDEYFGWIDPAWYCEDRDDNDGAES